MKNPAEPRRWVLRLRCLWHWDLWIASAFSVCVAIIFIQTDLKLKQTWFFAILTLSFAILGFVWHRWSTLRTQLQGSNYGEIVRMVDKSENEIRLPYTITCWIAFASSILSLMTAIMVAEIKINWVINFLSIVTIWLLCWLLLALASLLNISKEHDRNIAEIESYIEEMKALQRHKEAERQKASNIQEIEQET